jgi:replicative DNA helicase
MRLIASETRIDLGRMSEGTLSNDERETILNKCGELSEVNLITIDDTSGRTVWDIAGLARRMIRKEKLHLLVIDYMQLITATNRKVNRQEQVSEMSRSLKLLARELHVPVICLAQLNRQAEASDRPKLSHLRESGAIEQDADNVLFVHRQGFYDKSLPENDAEIIVAKQRNGPTNIVKAMWFREYTRFDSVATAITHGNYNPEFDDWSNRND